MNKLSLASCLYLILCVTNSTNAKIITQTDLATMNIVTLGSALLSHPEAQGDFSSNGYYVKSKSNAFAYDDDPKAPQENQRLRPSPKQCGITIDALKELIMGYTRNFQDLRKSTIMQAGSWNNKHVAFTTQKYTQITPTPTINSSVYKSRELATKTHIQRYVEHIQCSKDSTIIFSGDLHGSVHSLMRNLCRLIALGYVTPELTIKNPEKTVLIFGGDYVDRGRYGAEVVAILLTLKIKNWDSVHLLAGNHEIGSERIPISNGFLEELQCKYGKPTTQNDIDADVANLFLDIMNNVFNTLPVALFVTNNGNTLQFCHGGIEPEFEPGTFLSSKKRFCNVGYEDECAGLFWNDFCQDACDKTNERGGGTLCLGKDTVDQYRKANGIKAIIRAHQDTQGLLAFSNTTAPASPTSPIPGIPYTYAENGPYQWFDILQTNGNYFEAATAYINTFTNPVFTASSAVEPRNFPHDTFLLIKTNTLWAQWTVEFYDFFLGRGFQSSTEDVVHRHNKFVHIALSPSIVQSHTERVSLMNRRNPLYKQSTFDCITVQWLDTYDEKTVDQQLFKFAQAYTQQTTTPLKSATSPLNEISPATDPHMVTPIAEDTGRSPYSPIQEGEVSTGNDTTEKPTDSLDPEIVEATQVLERTLSRNALRLHDATLQALKTQRTHIEGLLQRITTINKGLRDNPNTLSPYQPAIAQKFITDGDALLKHAKDLAQKIPQNLEAKILLEEIDTCVKHIQTSATELQTRLTPAQEENSPTRSRSSLGSQNQQSKDNQPPRSNSSLDLGPRRKIVYTPYRDRRKLPQRSYTPDN